MAWRCSSSRWHSAAPLAGFNGGLVVEPDMDVLEEHAIADELVPPAIRLLEDVGALRLGVSRKRLVRSRSGRPARRPRVAHAAVRADGARELRLARPRRGEDRRRERRSRRSRDRPAQHHRRARRPTSRRRRSQPYYLDITHPRANKGAVVDFLSRRYEVPRESIATIGDGRNDVLMFDRSGLSIAMGNAHRGGPAGGAPRHDDERGRRLRERRRALHPRKELATWPRTPPCSSEWSASAGWAPGSSAGS